MANLSERKFGALRQIQLDTERMKKEFEKEALASKEVVNDTLSEKSSIKFSWKKRNSRTRIKRVFKKILDMTNQEHRDLFSLKEVFGRYLRGEPLPAGVIKAGEYGEVFDYDLTDYQIMNEHFRSVYGDDYQQAFNEAINSLNERDIDANEDVDMPIEVPVVKKSTDKAKRSVTAKSADEAGLED